MAVEARDPSWERLQPGALSIIYTVETLPRGTPGPPPKTWEAEFVTALGHYGHPRKPRVLAQVLGAPKSRCGNLRDYPAHRRIRALFQTAWDHYDIDAFEIRGAVVCDRSRLGHPPHPALAIFSGLRMSELGIESWGPRPEPEVPQPTPAKKRGPTAEEVLEQAVRARTTGGGS